MTVSCVRQLTCREEEILRLVVKGFTNAQIARELGISPKTVNTYMSRIYTKLDVNNRTSAAIVYLSKNGHGEGENPVSQSL